MRTLGPVFLIFVGACAVAACSATANTNIFGHGADGTGNSTNSSNSSSGAGNSGQGGNTGVMFDAGGTGGNTGGTTGVPCTVTDPNVDMDKDGWTPAQGDCNDCDPNVNPGAIDVLQQVDGGMPVWGDEDCSGVAGDVPPPCDTGLAVDDPSAVNAAKAIEICTVYATATHKWGLKSAKWVLPDGSPPSAAVPDPFGGTPGFTVQQAYDLGHGILSAFGPNVKVQGGQRMLGLSSGTARQPTDPGYQDVSGFDKGYTTNSPVGFPKESPSCGIASTGTPHDGVGLEVELVAPTNAKGFSFSFNFFTYEWPDYVCTEFNDFFAALLMPFPAGQTDGSISFDSLHNPVSVNNAFVTVCGPPGTYGGKNFTCSLGDTKLIGTGFGTDTAGSDHGSTYWLQTQAPVTGHQDITLRWVAYDSGDGILDSTALVDNFQWIANAGTVTIGTTPVQTPK